MLASAKRASLHCLSRKGSITHGGIEHRPNAEPETVGPPRADGSHHDPGGRKPRDWVWATDSCVIGSIGNRYTTRKAAFGTRAMPRYLDFEVSLSDIQPRIWRRFLLRSSATFMHLHRAIQDSFGWKECHLWEFRLPANAEHPIAGVADAELYDSPVPEAKTVKLNRHFTGKQEGESCEYIYDFGDDWVHEVRLLGAVSEKEAFQRRLLGGELAGPPEDCGGVPGYEGILQFLATCKDPWDDPKGLEAWLGGWRSDQFDLPTAKVDFDR